MTTLQHAARIAALSLLAAIGLGWLTTGTAIFFDDGIRYITQAQALDRGSLADGLLKAVDHPMYPTAIAVAHRVLGGTTPQAWQNAGQAAAVFFGVMLVAPLYLVGLELFGTRAAWLGVMFAGLVPLTGHVLADVLSEGTFLVFWTWGLYAALRFLREGKFVWLPPTIGCAAFAYLSRPEGLLLPAALVASLFALPWMRSTRMNWPRWWAAVGVLVIGPLLIVGPYVVAKGGIGTKPAVRRLLGTEKRSAPDAVERAEPFDPSQSLGKTYLDATKAVFGAVRQAVTTPLLPLAVFGLIVSVRRSWATRGRGWLLLGIIASAAVLALVRLHATGGYCSARHAMVLALPLILASAAGLDRLLTSLPVPGTWLGLRPGEKFSAGPVLWVFAIGAIVAWNKAGLVEPINFSKAGYKDAGAWVAAHVEPGAKVADATGLALFYSGHPGYTFANLIESPGDASLRWVVVRENHLIGPWWYCKTFSTLVEGLKPVATFPKDAKRGQARVHIYERPERIAEGAKTRR